MLNSKTITRASLALLGFTFLGIAQVQADDHKPLRTILKQLDLTSQQRQDVRQVMQQSRQDISVYKQDLKQINQQLESAVHSTNWDEQQVTSLIKQKQAIKSQLAYSRASNQHYLWHTLDAQQQEKFEQLRIDRTKTRDKKNLSRMLNSLDLSESQRLDVEALLAQQKAQKRTILAQLKQYKRAQTQLIKNPVFDEQAWQQNHQQMQDTQLAVAVNMARTKNQIWNLLEPHQQSELQAIQEKRRDAKRERRNKM